MILVAGGTGRLGRLVATRLAGQGEPVRVLTRNPSAAGDLAAQGLELVPGDVRSASSLGPAMLGVSTVVSAVHGLVGAGGVTPASVDRDGNRNLIDAAGPAAAVILLSTIGASADHPMELFRMKWAAEEYLRGSGEPWTIVRSSSFAETWVELLRSTSGASGRPRVFGRGDNPVNFVRVNDVADAVVHAALSPELRGQVIEVGGPDNLTLNQLAHLVVSMDAPGSMDVPGAGGRLRHIPRLGLRVMGTLARPVNPMMARLARASLAMDTCDMTFDPAVSTRKYPWLSCSPIEMDAVLARD